MSNNFDTSLWVKGGCPRDVRDMWDSEGKRRKLVWSCEKLSLWIVGNLPCIFCVVAYEMSRLTMLGSCLLTVLQSIDKQFMATHRELGGKIFPLFQYFKRLSLLLDLFFSPPCDGKGFVFAIKVKHFVIVNIEKLVEDFGTFQNVFSYSPLRTSISSTDCCFSYKIFPHSYNVRFLRFFNNKITLCSM